MNEPIIESFVIKVTARVVEDQDEVVMRTVQHIGGEMFCDITIDRHKVIEALTDYVEKCRGYRKQSEGEWISVDERLPDESGEYLAYTNRGNCSTLSYSARHKMFNAFDCLSKKFAKGYHIDVTHWMPIPEAPKMDGGK